ncbi:dsbGoxidized, partial [Escherichia coli EC1870]
PAEQQPATSAFLTK